MDQVKRRKLLGFLSALLAGVLGLSACSALNSNPSPPTPFANVFTQAAATLQAKDLQSPTPLPPTDTLAPLLPNTGGTLAPTLSVTTTAPASGVQATPQPPPATTGLRCNWAQLVGINGSAGRLQVEAGTKFDVVWRLRNIGSCAWTSAYSLVFYTGNRFGAPDSVNLPGTVAPGQTVDLHMTFSAPARSGLRQGLWMLSDPAGHLFGSGPGAELPFEVDVQVQPPLRQPPGKSPTDTPPPAAAYPPAATPQPPAATQPPQPPATEPKPTKPPAPPAPSQPAPANPPGQPAPPPGNSGGSGNNGGSQGSGGSSNTQGKDKSKPKPNPKPKDKGKGKGKH